MSRCSLPPGYCTPGACNESHTQDEGGRSSGSHSPHCIGSNKLAPRVKHQRSTGWHQGSNDSALEHRVGVQEEDKTGKPKQTVGSVQANLESSEGKGKLHFQLNTR